MVGLGCAGIECDSRAAVRDVSFAVAEIVWASIRRLNASNRILASFRGPVLFPG